MLIKYYNNPSPIRNIAPKERGFALLAVNDPFLKSTFEQVAPYDPKLDPSSFFRIAQVVILPIREYFSTQSWHFASLQNLKE